MQQTNHHQNIHDEARASHLGDRKINQDRCNVFTHDDLTVLVLADGMGGHPKGEMAAQIVIDTTYHLLKTTTSSPLSIKNLITNIFLKAHRQIIQYGLSKKPPIYPRTTAVIVVIQNNQMYWSHLGDSRTYLFRHGRAHLRTLDHTRVEHLRLIGEIEDSDTQSLASGRSGVSRCLGGLKKILDINISPAIPLQNGDVLLLCSDGVWSQLKEAKLEAIMLQDKTSLESKINNLVSQATQSAHPNSDNATALALCWHTKENTVYHHTQDGVDSALEHLRHLINHEQ